MEDYVLSDWNMALATLYSIRRSLDICNEAHRSMDFNRYRIELRVLYKELSPFMSEEEREKIKGLVNDCAKPAIDHSKTLVRHEAAEEALRSFAHAKHMLMPLKRDPTKALSGGYE